MMTRAKLTLYGVAAMAFLAAAFLSGESQPALAQGSIVCDYGSAKYKRCCNESYRRTSNMGARARADDIDACMKDRDTDARDRPADRRDSPASERRPRESGGGSGNRIRRVDCASANCPEGCDNDEIAISGFCPMGASATLDGDRKVFCATSEGSEWPKVLICAKR